MPAVDEQSEQGKKRRAQQQVRFAIAVLRSLHRELDGWEALHLAEAITACAAENWAYAAVLAETALVTESARAEAWQNHAPLASLEDLEEALLEVFPSPDVPSLESH